MNHVVDLNFRINGSTAAAWLRGAVERERGPVSMRLRGSACERGFDHLLRIARAAMERGALIPLGLYDPAASATAGLPGFAGSSRARPGTRSARKSAASPPRA